MRITETNNNIKLSSVKKKKTDAPADAFSGLLDEGAEDVWVGLQHRRYIRCVGYDEIILVGLAVSL